MSNSKRNKGKEKDNEWQERVVQIRRVTKVVKGGKKLSFRAIIVIGNEKGQVGVGVGKASDVIGAVKKAVTRQPWARYYRGLARLIHTVSVVARQTVYLTNLVVLSR